MIRRASIGVGIAGLEGTASSRAADYSIVQFRFLHTLLFVHGWWCYRRISKLSVDAHMAAAWHSADWAWHGRGSHCSDASRIQPTDSSLNHVCIAVSNLAGCHTKQSPLHLPQSVLLLDIAAASGACWLWQVPRMDERSR